MDTILLQLIPFFAIIGLGYAAGVTKIFPPEATAALSKFVFFFALSAMLFRFAANLSLSEIFDVPFITAYLSGTMLIYLIATAIAMIRRKGMQEAAIEAQCAVIGNVGFLGIPVFIILLGPQSIGPVMLALAVDLILFSSLVVILITAGGGDRMTAAVFKKVAFSLFKNPMVVSITCGIVWSFFNIPIPKPMNDFLDILGAAAAPGALFAIGASLADKSAGQVKVASWLSFCKLVLHPAAVAFFALYVFDVAPYAAAVMIALAALPVAGNVYIIAQHYNVAPQRASAAILISTILSIITLTVILKYVMSF
ncbi:AEC family transporter [Amylibacter sp. SFDW26]|uniref:AEC family transporter n=1 Tax=Amylibacter sp. SFDW26 TaxID=2652722 RepID=UPI0012614B10|nr:AEC family transporter [Amylibacter sp. SFDW26]KAB7616301.1 AEC family transporter [Amylibacter sp. SFDW26]